jgi:thiol:disulfide interchange protein
MSEAERWREVGNRMDECRESEQRKRFDVGGFFDAPKPSPWRWIVPAFFGVVLLATGMWHALSVPDGSEAFGHGFGAALGVVWGAEQLAKAAKTWRAGR